MWGRLATCGRLSIGLPSLSRNQQQTDFQAAAGCHPRMPSCPTVQFKSSTPLTGYNYSMLKPTEKIWHNGRFIAWDDAKIHVLSHVTSYGSSVFEGIRCYATATGPAIFRLLEHVRRMLDSAKIERIEKLSFTTT